MKALPIIGVLSIVLGVLSYLVPLPHHEKHGVSLGDAKFSVQTENSKLLPSAVGVILIGGGVVALVLGMRKS
jgi:uncharacterized membrane protein